MAGIDDLFRRRKKPGPKPKEETKEKQAEEKKEDPSLTLFVESLKEYYAEERPNEVLTDKLIAAHLLADGRTVAQTAEGSGVTERTIYRWKHDIDFMELVDELSLTTGIATTGGRIRQIKRVIRQIIVLRRAMGLPESEKDLLEWQKEARAEMKETRLFSDDQLDKLADILTSSEDQADATGRPGEADGEDGDEARISEV